MQSHGLFAKEVEEGGGGGGGQRGYHCQQTTGVAEGDGTLVGNGG